MSKKEKKPHEYRGVRDEIRQQQLKTKDMTVKEKLKYFWDYYKFHTIAGIIILVIAINLIHDIITAKDCIFYAFMFNSSQLSSSEIETSFAEYADLDTENYECIIDTASNISLQSYSQYDMATSQKIMALVQAGDLDTVMMGSDIFYNYALSEMFVDLRTVLTEDELNRYKDHLYYIDYAEVALADENSGFEEENITLSGGQSAYSAEDILAEAESHRNPQNMEEPVPVGIYMIDSPFIIKTGAYTQSMPVFGIIVTSLRTDTGKQYLDFLWDETIDFSQMISEY